MIEQTVPYALAAEEDRCAPRFDVHIPSILRPSGEAGFKVIVTNLSVAGFACDVVTGMRAGARCWLTLPGLSGLQAEIVWNNHGAVGGAFSNLINEAVLATIVARYRTGG
ncbi:PilZ domain-containing protein [Sphingomonas gilva]|uniref:PilZ domain-containing protein n=2 Tax=Sphingomonas gilva TaxID=2305907 RepID=A0A396RK19_9SPHN|nr:PilZ domain-containing protein [Sphingomonas gilva]